MTNALRGAFDTNWPLNMVDLANQQGFDFAFEGISLEKMFGLLRKDYTEVIDFLELNYLHFAKKDATESNAQLLKRIHKRLKQSILNGFPPVVAIEYQTEETHHEDDDRNVWGTYGGHAVTVMSIQSQLNPHAMSFIVEALDPDNGHIYHLTISSPEGENNFGSLIYVPTNKGLSKKWSGNLTNPIHKSFLIVHAPMFGFKRNLDWDRRLIYTFTGGIVSTKK